MDGELFEDETADLLDRIRREPEARKDWEIYHLIGDVLRQPEHIHCDLSAKVRERMQGEPTVLAPRHRAARQQVRTVALSAAASLLAVSVVAWMSVQVAPEPRPQMAMQQPDWRPTSTPIKPESNDYLMAHQEFSPSTHVNGGASYIRTVAYSADRR
jgi:sigma-E factor negative regulatory protein RseA